MRKLRCIAYEQLSYSRRLLASQAGGLRGAAIMWLLGAPAAIVILALFMRGC